MWVKETKEESLEISTTRRTVYRSWMNTIWVQGEIRFLKKWNERNRFYAYMRMIQHDAIYVKRVIVCWQTTLQCLLINLGINSTFVIIFGIQSGSMNFIDLTSQAPRELKESLQRKANKKSNGEISATSVESLNLRGAWANWFRLL